MSLDNNRNWRTAAACLVIVIPMALISLLGVWPLSLFRASAVLEAVQDKVDINGDGPAIMVTRLQITNKGRTPVKIYEIQINGREDKNCISKPDKSYDVGDTFVMGVPWTCGNLVRAMAKTDQGDLEFNW